MRKSIAAFLCGLMVWLSVAPSFAAPPAIPPTPLTASSVSNVGGALLSETTQSRFGNVGFRTLAGHMTDYSVGSSIVTFEDRLAVSQDFDWVRPVYAAGNLTASVAQTISAKIWAVSDTNDVPSSVSSGTAVTFSGASTVSLVPPSATGRDRRYYFGDWIKLPAIARTDGGSLPLIQIRTILAANTGTTATFNGDSTALTGWDSQADGRVWRRRKITGDGTNTSFATFASIATSTGQSPLVGMQYMARGRVVTIMVEGDSIYEGAGSTTVNEGWALKAAAALSDKTKVTYEVANMAWIGSDYNQITTFALTDLQAGFSPDIVFLPSGTPNGAVPPMDSSTINSERAMLFRLLAEAKTQRVAPIIGTWIPANPSVKAWNASDSYRQAYNTNIVRPLAVRGYTVADFDYVMAGITDVNGQVNIKVGSTTDNIHPNDTGNAAMATVAKNAILKAGVTSYGILITQ